MPGFFVAVDGSWLRSGANKGLLKAQRCPVGRGLPLDDRCRLSVMFRKGGKGPVAVDRQSCSLQNVDSAFIPSSVLATEILESGLSSGVSLFYFEGSSRFARVIYLPCGSEVLDAVRAADSSLRLEVHDLPPATTTLVTSAEIVRALLKECERRDSELFGQQATRFLNGPHMIEQLLVHLMELREEDAQHFADVAKLLASQLRGLLSEDSSSIKIHKMARSHSEAWEAVRDRRLVFIDGGGARLSPIPGVQSAALRAGIYSVIPGDRSASREKFEMDTWLIAEMISARDPDTPPPDRKRLQEACRYILELGVALRQMKGEPAPLAVFLHGPLVNQFVAYDDEEPNFLPDVNPEFLSRLGVTEAGVQSKVSALPAGADRWHQFMAVYAFLLEELRSSEVPLMGAVERPTGTQVVDALLAQLVEDGVINEAGQREFRSYIDRFEMTDEFLLGCLLAEGEYFDAVQLTRKNPPNRAHDSWQEVVRDYFKPFATVLKPSDAAHPIRLEFNPPGVDRLPELMKLVYHMSRLLPHYAFPVGLDIADKYAKVPDWIARGVDARLAAVALRRALADGDASLFAQVRLLLSGQRRDFFYRPKS